MNAFYRIVIFQTKYFQSKEYALVVDVPLMKHIRMEATYGSIT